MSVISFCDAYEKYKLIRNRITDRLYVCELRMLLWNFCYPCSWGKWYEFVFPSQRSRNFLFSCSVGIPPFTGKVCWVWTITAQTKENFARRKGDRCSQQLQSYQNSRKNRSERIRIVCNLQLRPLPSEQVRVSIVVYRTTAMFRHVAQTAMELWVNVWLR